MISIIHDLDFITSIYALRILNIFLHMPNMAVPHLLHQQLYPEMKEKKLTILKFRKMWIVLTCGGCE